MVNRLWSILFQQANMERGDWLRICPDGLKDAPDSSLSMARAMLGVPDRNIRGWAVEAAVNLALRSSQGKRILALDPNNTYDAQLSGKHCFFEVAPGWAATASTVDRDVTRYHQQATVSLDPSSGECTVVTSEGDVITTTAPSIGRTFHLPFTETSTVDVTIPFDEGMWTPDPENENNILFTLKGRILPHGPAARLVQEGLATLYAGGFLPSSSDPLIERIGQVSVRLLEGA